MLAAGLVAALTWESWAAMRTFGLRFLMTSHWDPVAGEFGALPFIYGTLVSSLLALLIAVPLSLGAAIFLAELAPAWVRPPVAFRPGMGMERRGPAPARGPLWFRKMDLNGDGDVSPREFLGTLEAFKKLDLDGDGLISREEAEAAEALRREKK